jgi:cell wall-associated NlpC family hydrolase
MSEIGENKDQQEERIDEIGLMPLAKDFLIELSDLRPGDILLFRSIDKKMHQRKISRVTKSPYTHAAIYIGSGEIAESKLPKVRIRKLSDADKTGGIIGVLRSQTVFSARRAAAIKEFVDALISQNAKYDLSGALTFKRRNQEFVKGLIDHHPGSFRRSLEPRWGP